MFDLPIQSPKAPTCIDLFSGAGGLSLGFLLAGGMPLGAVDNDIDATATYRRLFPMAKEVHCGDIKEWHSSLRKGEIDVVIGGPPCQGFSLARGTRFVDDPRNHLYKEFVRIVSYFQPRFMVMENVQGITNLAGGQVLMQILEDFENIGYQLDYRIVNMAEYGVPQLRKRAIFVGSRSTDGFEWPNKLFRSNKKKPTLFEQSLPTYNSVNDALGDIDLPQGNYFSHRANSQMRGPRNRCAHNEPAFTLRVRGDEFALCEEPATAAFIPGPEPEAEIQYFSVQNPLQEFFRQKCPDWAKTKTRRTSAKNKKTLNGTRKLTIREQARLQSFPDWVEFNGSRSSQARQVGNAVPPLFGYHLFRAMFSCF